MKHLLLATLCTAVATPAQTFVVDAANGPGALFTDLPAAISAVPDGSTLLVRPGAYSGFALLQRSLTILGGPGVVVRGGIQVLATLPGQRVLLRELDTDASPGPDSGIFISNCDGPVIVDRCRSSAPAAAGSQVHVTYCSAPVHLSGVAFAHSGAEPLRITIGDVTVVDSDLRSTTGHALLLAEGRVRVSGTRLEGSGPFDLHGEAVVWVQSPVSQLVLDDTVTLVGSAGPATDGVKGNGALVVDPGLQLQNVGALVAGGPATGLTVISADLASCTASTGPPGGVATGTLTVPPGGIGALLVGFPGDAATFPGILFPLWLDPVLVSTIAVGAPTVTGSYPVPNAAFVLGVPVGWQGIAFDQTNGLQFSNPGVYVH